MNSLYEIGDSVVVTDGKGINIPITIASVRLVDVKEPIYGIYDARDDAGRDSDGNKFFYFASESELKKILSSDTKTI